jgi:hypothetical protein
MHRIARPRVGRRRRAADICFLFELLVYPLAGDADQTKGYEEHKSKQPELVVQSGMPLGRDAMRPFSVFACAAARRCSSRRVWGDLMPPTRSA